MAGRVTAFIHGSGEGEFPSTHGSDWWTVLTPATTLKSTEIQSRDRLRFGLLCCTLLHPQYTTSISRICANSCCRDSKYSIESVRWHYTLRRMR
jgi:hypothetical protein